MDNYKSELLDVFNELVRVCKLINLKIWIHSGTLLGQVRHEGKMIPWDDDIDVMSSQKEWDLKKDDFFKEINKKNYFVYDLTNKKEYPNELMRVVRLYSRTPISIGNGEVTFPFVEIFIAVPSELKSNFGWWWNSAMWKSSWIFHEGFNRYQKRQDKKSRCFFLNLITFPIKFLFFGKVVKRTINPDLTKKDYNWNLLRRNDMWSNRKFEYDISKMQKVEFEGVEILMSHKPEEELLVSYGSSWMVEKISEPHHLSKDHLFHRRNINAKKIICELNDGDFLK